MTVFCTDLDNTMIYSYKHEIGEDKRCVEIYQGREISFITQETYILLGEVKKQAMIVPVTTRTVDQYQRIDLGVGTFPYALTCNGGVLLIDGCEDESWYQESLQLIRGSRQELLRAVELLEQEKRRTFEVRFIRELFIFTKCEEPEMVVDELKSSLDENLVDVFHNGIKVYVVPKELSKGKAIERFRAYVGAERVIAAGDSEFDISMLETADCGIAAPELSGAYRFADNVKCPPADKLFAEKVLETVLMYCQNGQ